MELSVLKKPDLVVALDIGSTYSGFAWQWRSDFEKNRGNIAFNVNWGTASPKLHKTTTCLLLNENKEIDSFGQVAEKKFCDECDRADGKSLAGQWYFFKGFKMLLYNCEKPNELQVDDHSGQPMPLIEVMSKLIRAMKENFLTKMRARSLNLKKVLWVVTVPAIWSDSSKNFMSEAALMGGIERKNLLIAHEPEAAAIHCIHLPREERLAFGGFGEKGDTFLTVDLGGGTTDVLALHVRDDGTMEEISLGSGGLVGGQDINNAFFQACNDAFKGNVWMEVTNKSHAVELLDMENDFESKKVTIGTDDFTDESMKLLVPEVFRSLLDKGKITLTDEGGNKKRFTIKNGKMYFSSEFIRESLFNETIRRMLEFLREILQRDQVKSVKNIVLVGGFSESPIVVKTVEEFIQENFEGKNVIVPTSPLSAVLSGAVLYGHDPFIFHSRICRATYGIGTNRLFDCNLHKEEKKWKNKENEKEYCKDVFDIHVEKGSSVKLGKELPSETYCPMYESQTSVTIPIYMSTEQHLTGTVYTTEDHCKKLGEIEVEMSDTTGGTSREVTVTMIYGGTELDVTAKNEVSGDEYKTTLQFDTS